MLKWKDLTEQQIDQLFNDMIEEIFKEEDINKLSKFEMRKIIYNYLVNNKQYDHEYMEGIYSNYHNRTNKNKFSRNLMQEFMHPLITEKGVCNGFAQIYKVLLEKIGVYAMCLNCAVEFNNEYVGHQLNLVYDDEFDTYNFDDITFGIQNNTTEEYFNYENPEEKTQGIGPLTTFDSKEIKWAVVGDEYVNLYMKRDSSPIKRPQQLNELFNKSTNMLIEDRKELQKYGVNIKKVDNCDIISRRR
jgi:hypothetical protein